MGTDEASAFWHLMVPLANFGASGVYIALALITQKMILQIVKSPEELTDTKRKLVNRFMEMCWFLALIACLTGIANAVFNQRRIAKLTKTAGEQSQMIAHLGEETSKRESEIEAKSTELRKVAAALETKENEIRGMSEEQERLSADKNSLEKEVAELEGFLKKSQELAVDSIIASAEQAYRQADYEDAVVKLTMAASIKPSPENREKIAVMIVDARFRMLRAEVEKTKDAKARMKMLEAAIAKFRGTRYEAVIKRMIGKERRAEQ